MFIVNGQTVEISETTNPNIFDFVNPNLDTKLSIVSPDGVFEYEYHMLFGYGVADFTKGDNIIRRLGIYSFFTNADCIWIDGKRYEIDKQLCTPDSLFLKSPLQSDDVNQIIYKSIVIKDSYSYSCSATNEIKKRILKINGCKDCSSDDLCEALQLLHALEINECSSITDKRRIMARLANIIQTKSC